MNDAAIESLDASDQMLTPLVTGRLKRSSIRWAWYSAVAAAALLVVSLLVWQGVTAQGNPDPTVAGMSKTAVVMDTGILVFREGLEAILVLAALTASLVRTEEGYWRPVALGAGASFLASVATWFIVVAIISDINAPELHIQAATGLLAVVVLLVIMNWFFHKVYWTGWITHHNRRKQALTQSPDRSRSAIYRGLMLIGFTSVYREGFEVVLFLQSLRLKAGSDVVLEGVLIGLALTLIVAWLTFVAHYRLPYKRMLVLTGVMIGAVLLVMVGESVQEMQQAGWVSTTTLSIPMPDWMNTWFAVYPSAQSLLSQAAAGIFVVGSYFLARRVCTRRPTTELAVSHQCIVPDCANCNASKPSEIK
ncbi:MAG: FTR1 family protein [Tepidisphaeraceae bacterium]|jgi:high-affinity iron transporter